MKAVLISIQPKWVEKIASGEKTIEVRKSRPKLETPFKCYIYCTKPSKKYQTICGCMVINTDELYRLPNGEIKHDWSGELMTVKEEYTKDNFLNGKVIGEFVCDRIAGEGETIRGNACLTVDELIDYCNGKDLYFWHISDLKIYDKPKELSEFKGFCRDAYCQDDYGKPTWFCKDGYGSCAVKDKELAYPYNDECIYFDCPRYGECCEYEDFAYCLCKGIKPITRPPQSWCYVEELQNG